MMRSLGRRPSDQELAEAVAGVMGSCTLTLLPHPAHTLLLSHHCFHLAEHSSHPGLTVLVSHCALTLVRSHLAAAQGWRKAWT